MEPVISLRKQKSLSQMAGSFCVSESVLAFTLCDFECVSHCLI